MPKSSIVVGDIAGGTSPLKRDIGTNLTIDHIWSVYRWYPGFRDTINLEVDALFSNGINEDDKIEITRMMECKDCVRWGIMAGYSAAVVDARGDGDPKIESWHPYVDGVGFVFSEFSTKGHPLKIKVYLKSGEANPIEYEIPHYPCETDDDGELIDEKPLPNEYGFFHLRTQGNIRGSQGLPQYMHLIDAFKIQWDIINAYAPYAEKQGMAFPAVYLQDNSPTNRTNVKNQFSNQPTSNRLLIMSNEDLVEWISPQAGAYDPFPMLQWLNSILARSSQMNKLMLEGDPSGYLSASETAISNWEGKLIEKQAYWRTQLLPIWMALGASDQCNFQDPTKPTFISLMEGIKNMREALEGIVDPQQIVDLMNEYLMKNDQDVKLKAMSKEEMMEYNNPRPEESDQRDQADQAEAGV